MNKMVSNYTILDNYETSLKNLRFYKQYAQQKSNCALLQILEVTITKNNISRAQLAILEGYKASPNSISTQHKSSPFWSITHDGISKFGTEYNGVVLRGVTIKLEPLHIPYGLRKMKGVLDAHDTAVDIIDVIAEYFPVANSAFITINSILDELEGTTDTIRPVPPQSIKLGKVLNVDEEEKVIHIGVHENMPIAANTGDGVSVNVKAARVLRELCGIKSHDFRCAFHISGGGVIKRATTSKNMNVPELTVLYETIRTVVKHFEGSIKNQEILGPWNKRWKILNFPPST